MRLRRVSSEVGYEDKQNTRCDAKWPDIRLQVTLMIKTAGFSQTVHPKADIFNLLACPRYLKLTT